jgi:hypothetical protein
MSDAEGAPKTEKKPGQKATAQDSEINKDAEDTKEGYGWGV